MSSQTFSKNILSASQPLLRTTALAGVAGLSLLATPAHAAAPNVVATIKPLHSIAAAVMEGVGTPHILIDGAASPHGFALKPSQAFLIQGADAVFWIGPELAPSLQKPIESMADDAAVIELMDAPGVHHLGVREGANFDAHDHDHGEEHEGDAHETHAHEGEDDERGHQFHSHEEPSHDHGHDLSEIRDAHIWLNPENGIAIAEVMAETLAKLDPEHAVTYLKNAEAFARRIVDLEKEIKGQLEPVAGKKFIVFHDAYHHFEHHFDMEASGAITLSPEALSSADRIAETQDRINALDVTCVFQEPQFETKLVDVALEGSDARKGVLDPLGTELENGPGLYPKLLKNMAASLVNCLTGQS